MLLENYYYWFESALPEKLCDKIITLGKSKKIEQAAVNDKEKDLLKIRNSKVSWLNDKFIYEAIHPYITEANQKAGWNFIWDHSEDCQFTEYNENQFYDWHPDQNIIPYNNPKNLNFHGKIRKLSVTVSLSDPKEYEGGNLEFDYKNNREGKNLDLCTKIKPKGSIIVFPSFVWHRITPVTKGKRYSLVMWNIGKPFQ